MAGEWLQAPRAPVGDAERVLVARLLRASAAEGRMSTGEYEARMKRVKAAKIVGELAPLVVDLDGAPPMVREPSAEVVYVPVTRAPLVTDGTAGSNVDPSEGTAGRSTKGSAGPAGADESARPTRTPAQEWSDSFRALAWTMLLFVVFLGAVGFAQLRAL